MWVAKRVAKGGHGFAPTSALTISPKAGKGVVTPATACH